MCSISGAYNSSVSFKEYELLNYSMSHRGPDNTNVQEYKFNNRILFLGHNRLAIQDLDIKANQPMESARFSIVFNGEIYNHMELRTELESKFTTHSDTETLLSLFEQYGIEKTISKLIGMFSIALFDKKEDKLYLIRDRVGIKPLYWTFQNGEFSFASELKGISSHLKKRKNDKALIQFMSFGYISDDNSYYENIYKLKPAHYLIFDGKDIDIKRYWDLPQTKINISYEEALERTENIIRSSIKYRLLSDVEVGSFLSGGVDSSLVSAILQQESSSNLKTFSIGFEDKRYDESVYALEVAKYIGSEHYEYKFKVTDVIDLINKLDYNFDEPFGDASSLPMMILSKMTKQHVTVALSGDGGDELFTGYERYFITDSYYTKLSKLPQSIRSILSIIAKYSRNDKLQKVSYPLKNFSEQNLYALLYSSTKPWELNSLFNKEFLRESFGKSDLSLLDILEYDFLKESDNFTTSSVFREVGDLIDCLSRLDFHRYLPDDILTKVDRASMAYGLEARVPLLDHRVVEFAYSLPTALKLKYGSKSILKDILYKQIPKELIERPKRGFSVPLKEWFRSELKGVVYDKINSLDARFNKKYLLKVFNEHQKGRNFEYVLWNVMRVK